MADALCAGAGLGVWRAACLPASSRPRISRHEGCSRALVPAIAPAWLPSPSSLLQPNPTPPWAPVWLPCPGALPTHAHAPVCRRIAPVRGAVSASEAAAEAAPPARVAATSKRVLVIGGTGRVGGSTAAALARRTVQVEGEEAQPMAVAVAGRSRERAQRVLASVPQAEFLAVDITDKASVLAAVQGADVVVHTAGPFQRATAHPWAMNVLEACIETRTAYVDVCDDCSYALRAKGYHDAARQAGVPAITTGGIYPGVSNLMAAELVREAGTGPAKGEAGGERKPERIRFSYFTAGSGGAGPVILQTSFLLMGEDVVAFRKGQPVRLKPYSGGTTVDFGKGIGKRAVYLLQLPEVESVHRCLGVPSVSARFGTAPFFWNTAMQAVGLLPRSFLNDRRRVASLAALSEPLVRAVDARVGEACAMRVDLDCSDGVRAASLYSHRRLSECVGTATAAFAQAVLEGAAQPGVWYPEEEGGVAVAARSRLLERASEGCIQFVTNKSPWMIERPPKNLGFGMYIE